MTETRDEIRQRVLKLRLALDASCVASASRRICRRLAELSEYGLAHCLAAYWPFRNEVDTRSLIEDALASGKTVALPVVDRSSRTMAMRPLTSPADLKPGSFGILEPSSDEPPLRPEDIDLCVVPGVAFDPEGNRLGYGGGFYDRYLRLLRRDCLLIAVCMERQVVPAIPWSPEDVPMDMIVTESRVIIPERTGR